MVVTEKCDVYSIRVVALEIMFENHPGDFLSSMVSKKLDQSMMLQDLWDKRPPSPNDVKVFREMVHVVEIALKCVSHDPEFRPLMNQVSKELAARQPSLSMPFRAISMLELMHLD
ncbi:hypothetical protein ACS0TY_006949 [Phlomoides rotata]